MSPVTRNDSKENEMPKTLYAAPDWQPPTPTDLARAALDERTECILAKRCLHGHAPDSCYYAMGEVCS